jgi:hypothetical protein
MRGKMLARLIADQWRPLVSMWLLLTLPILCHNDTAAMLIGALTGGHLAQHHVHSVASADRHHAQAGAAGHTAHLAVDAGSPERHGDNPMPEWCAGHGAGSAAALPDGQVEVAFAATSALVLVDVPHDRTPCDGDGTPNPLVRPPPAPPPRLLG